MTAHSFRTISDQDEVLARYFAIAGQPQPTRGAKMPDVAEMAEVLTAQGKHGRGKGQVEVITANVSGQDRPCMLLYY